MTPAIGLALHPNLDYLERVAPLLEREVDVLEVAPETTWYLDPRGELRANGYHARFLALAARHTLPFIAHGVGLSPGSAGGPARRQRWLDRLAADQQRFSYRWYTDHLGASVLADHELALPIGLPMTATSVAIVRASLADMQRVVPCVGLENTAFYFTIGDPQSEPDFVRRCVGGDHHLLLDLHNLHTMAENLGLDPGAYLARLDLDRVLEIHLSGGSTTDPAWFPGPPRRLDSHDDHVPEPVWQLFERVLPRCPGLRAVIVERMDDSLGPGDELVMQAELRRARRLVQRLHRPGTPPTRSTPTAAIAPEDRAAALTHERRLAAILGADDPLAALAASDDPTLHTIDQPGLRLAALLIARLRFERLQHGDPAAHEHFERDPAGFADRFRRYHHSVAPSAAFPQDEAALYRGFSA
ncbi:DUF692 family multinuclear iron-containing protein [Nannocystis sp.]|uniref:DUF692 domain-containing protein n=1 Tax=Nannocystis sp. TaxID=1962667 RepID=UPI0025FC13BB|nr:DUF692 family multinuclear iron-containing protein [Nannocystis sp.]